MRKPRRIVEGARYHVVARANRKEFILEPHEMKSLFLSVVAQARRRHNFAIDTLCVMNNHIHLLVRPGRGESLSRIMQWILSVFAMRFNRTLGLSGHVWYDRFRSVVIESLRQFIRAYDYIEQNPVRARMVNSATEYSYGGYWTRRAGPRGAVGPPGLFTALLFPRSLVPQITGF